MMSYHRIEETVFSKGAVSGGFFKGNPPMTLKKLFEEDKYIA
jgi:hypothetical protein